MHYQAHDSDVYGSFMHASWWSIHTKYLSFLCLLMWKMCCHFVCVCLCVSAYVLHYVALFPSCRLLENSAILDQYERASMKYENAERRFTPAWCWWWWRNTLAKRILNMYSLAKMDAKELDGNTIAGMLWDGDCLHQESFETWISVGCSHLM